MVLAHTFNPSTKEVEASLSYRARACVTSSSYSKRDCDRNDVLEIQNKDYTRKKNAVKLGVVAHAFNPKTWEAEAGRSL